MFQYLLVYDSDYCIHLITRVNLSQIHRKDFCAEENFLLVDRHVSFILYLEKGIGK